MTFLKLEDYVIFVLCLISSLGIGLFYAIRNRSEQITTRRFLLGDGKMSIIPVAFSMMVTFQSGIMMLGIPAEVYMYGMQCYMSSIGGFVSDMLCLHIFIPSLKKLNVTSVNHYLELRYNSHGIRLFLTCISILSTVNYLGTVTFVPAVTLEMVAGIPVWISVTTLMSVVVVYTIIGGLTAVIWTDVLQAILMFGGMIAIIFKGTMEAGGVASTWNIVRESGRLNFLDFDPDPTLRQSFWSLFIGGLISGLRMSPSQSTYQRIKATPSVSTAKKMYFLSGLLSLFISSLAVTEGAVMFAYFQTKGCDPLEAKQLRNQNQLMVKMVHDISKITPGLPGLFLASLFSASLSTMSSLLSSLSAVFWEDIVKPHTKPMSDRKAILVTKCSVLLFGGIALLVTFAISGIEGPISRILDITGACFTGAMVGVFVLGWFIPRANALGGFVGGLVCVIFVGWISVGKLISSGVRVNAKLGPASTENCPLVNISGFTNGNIYVQMMTEFVSNDTDSIAGAGHMTVTQGPQGLDVLYSLSYKWLLPLGICLVVGVGALVSRLQARKPVDPSLTVPVCDYLCCCIPERIRKKFRCGIKYPGRDEETAQNEETAVQLIGMEPITEDISVRK